MGWEEGTADGGRTANGWMGVYYDDDEATHTLVCMPVSSGGRDRVSQSFQQCFCIFWNSYS